MELVSNAVVVFAPGSAVEIGGPPSVLGHVVRVILEGNGGVHYVVSWWAGRDRHEETMTASEVRPHHNGTQTHVGFRPTGELT